MANSIYWHDYETFGADPRRDRASQFAGLRTDEDLNIVGDPLVLYCQPAPDMLPHPMACLITGITPQKALAEGLPENAFIAAIHREFSVPQTCVSGYNSLRFDDELTRQLLYRNFYDAYEREWKNGNSRWDIIDMVRLCCALRPEGIVWPTHEDGAPSFRLEALTQANGIAHDAAHDALSDVMATLSMARLIRDKQPRLYAYVYALRDKHKVMEQLDIVRKTPVLHVSSMYPAALGSLALVAPLTRHPRDKNGVLVLDLREDPASWMSLTREQMQQRLFSPRSELDARGEARIPVKVLHVNRCPVVASSALLTPPLAQRYGIDMAKAQEYWQSVIDNPEAIARLASAFDSGAEGEPGEQNPDFQLYGGGFFGVQDKQAMAQIRSASPSELSVWPTAFVDNRLEEMLFRYRARNFPGSLLAEEQARWAALCRQSIRRPAQQRGAGASEAEFFAEIARLRAEGLTPEAAVLLEELERYAQEILAQTPA